MAATLAAEEEQLGDLTGLLREAAGGDARAGEALVEAVYGRLEHVAQQQMRARHPARRGDLTLDPAGLVNDTLMKLLEAPRDYENRRHFYAFATTVMLRVLQDYQRKRRAQKRGGDVVKLSISHLGRIGAEPSHEPQLDIDELPPVLEELARLDARKAEVVQLRVFFGLEMAEIADVIGVSTPTAERDWRFARRWLAARLDPGETTPR